MILGLLSSIWKEFVSAPGSAKRLLAWMFAFFLCGLTAVALAPLFKRRNAAVFLKDIYGIE